LFKIGFCDLAFLLITTADKENIDMMLFGDVIKVLAGSDGCCVTLPIGKALIGKEVDDSVEVKTPGGVTAYDIIEVMYK